MGASVYTRFSRVKLDTMIEWISLNRFYTNSDIYTDPRWQSGDSPPVETCTGRLSQDYWPPKAINA